MPTFPQVFMRIVALYTLCLVCMNFEYVKIVMDPVSLEYWNKKFISFNKILAVVLLLSRAYDFYRHFYISHQYFTKSLPLYEAGVLECWQRQQVQYFRKQLQPLKWNPPISISLARAFLLNKTNSSISCNQIKRIAYFQLLIRQFWLKNGEH